MPEKELTKSVEIFLKLNYSPNFPHWMTCEAYREYRDGINPELVQKDRVSYLRKVLKKRKELKRKLGYHEVDSESE